MRTRPVLPQLASSFVVVTQPSSKFIDSWPLALTEGNEKQEERAAGVAMLIPNQGEWTLIEKEQGNIASTPGSLTLIPINGKEKEERRRRNR
jgi:hypothetical protein